MIKPASPRAGQGNANVVEIDAIDVAEWERDQYTPRAPAAGLAELVRQTLPQPIAAEAPKRPAQVSQGGVSQTPRPAMPAARAPAAPPANSAPGGKPAVVPRAVDKHSAALQRALVRANYDRPAPPSHAPASTSDGRPTAPPRPTSTSPLTSDDRAASLPRVSPLASAERIAAPPDVPPGPSPLPRPAPTAIPSSMSPPPMRIQAESPRGASSDPTPTPKALGRASSPRLDGTASRAILSRLTSRRGIVLGGAAVGALLLVIVIAATRGSDPTARPAMSATLPRTGSVTALSPQPVHAAGAPPAPSTRDTAAAAAAVTTATSSDTPDASIASKASQLPAPPQPSTRKIAKAGAPPPDERAAPIAPDDEVPATARARAAYNEGNQALFVGNSDAAIRAYRQALSAAPTFPPGFRGLGLAYAQKGQNGLAIMSLRTYLTMAPHARDAALIKQRIAALQSIDP